MLEDLIKALQAIQDKKPGEDIKVLSNGGSGVFLLSLDLTYEDNWVVIEPETNPVKLQEVFG